MMEVMPNCIIGQGYGLSETCATVCIMAASGRNGVVGSAGQLIPGIVARVVREDGSLGGFGEQGELVVSGPAMAFGYLNNEKA